MDCIVWACGIAQTPEEELPPPMPGTSSQPDEFDEKERERIKALELEESDSEKEDSAHEEQDTQDSMSRGRVKKVKPHRPLPTLGRGILTRYRNFRNRQPCNSLKERQLGLIAAGVRRCRQGERK